MQLYFHTLKGNPLLFQGAAYLSADILLGEQSRIPALLNIDQTVFCPEFKMGKYQTHLYLF